MSDNILVTGNNLFFSGKNYRCAIGKSGFSDHKKEGDGCTPLGIFSLRECWYRADRMAAPKTGLPLHMITKDDGWCDDPESKEYNRHIKITSPSPLEGEGGVGGISPQNQALNMQNRSPLPNPPPQGGRGYERLWHDDHVYDIVVPIGYNDDPTIAGKGSAIFLHVAHADYKPTEGCVALAKEDFLALLSHLNTNSFIEIRKS